MMTPKQRFVTTLSGGIPDRLPVTTHHVMPSFLKTFMNGAGNDEFFDRFGLDPIRWVAAHKPDEARGEYYDPLHVPGYLEAKRVASDSGGGFSRRRSPTHGTRRSGTVSSRRKRRSPPRSRAMSTRRG
jgi:hypothetical protein